MDQSRGRAHGGSGPINEDWILKERPNEGYAFLEEQVSTTDGRIITQRFHLPKDTPVQYSPPYGGGRRTKRNGKKTHKRRR
jgi:hypothetical protein